ncbi:MAG: hypothetical protein GC137_08685 [Alphaproteobacteria bacterium]|nr:hypothetical protein [Alphaproteobacteria bacterium]
MSGQKDVRDQFCAVSRDHLLEIMKQMCDRSNQQNLHVQFAVNNVNMCVIPGTKPEEALSIYDEVADRSDLRFS